MPYPCYPQLLSETADAPENIILHSCPHSPELIITRNKNSKKNIPKKILYPIIEYLKTILKNCPQREKKHLDALISS